MSVVPKIYELNGHVIRKTPVQEKWSGGTRFTVGFPVCTLSEYVLDQGDAVVSILNMGEAYQAAEAKIKSALSALQECEAYFDSRADADCDQDGFIPNEEMKLLTEVREALGKLRA